MKFSHLSDCHIGCWRDPKLKDLNLQAFEAALRQSLEARVDFILIAGDLFHTSHPGLDAVLDVMRRLKEVKDAGVPVYLIAGSHDYSPSGRTMLDILEEAKLVTNVMRGTVADGTLRLSFTADPKTGAKLTGVQGRKGMLERAYYEMLDREPLEQEPGFKVFLFHSPLTELKPKELEQMESYSVTFMPAGFDYYAGGHVHIVARYDDARYRHVVYPGPLFPCNFAELEKLRQGGYYLYEDGTATFEPIALRPVVSLAVEADHLRPEEVVAALRGQAEREDLRGAIVLLRASGRLAGGRPMDVPFRALMEGLEAAGAYYVMKNTAKLVGEDFEEIKAPSRSVDEVESSVLAEHAGRVKGPYAATETELAKALITALAVPKDEGEKQGAYLDKMAGQAEGLMGITPSPPHPLGEPPPAAERPVQPSTPPPSPRRGHTAR